MVVESELHRWQQLKLLLTQSFLKQRISLDAFVASNLIDKPISNIVDDWFTKPRPCVSFNQHLCSLVAQQSYLKLLDFLTLRHFEVEENAGRLHNKLTDVRATAKQSTFHVQVLFQHHVLSNIQTETLCVEIC